MSELGVKLMCKMARYKTEHWAIPDYPNVCNASEVRG